MPLDQATAVYEVADATLLAQTPEKVDPSNRDIGRIDPAWSTLRGHLEARIGNLRNWRLSWTQHWAVLAQYLDPRRNIWLTQGATTQPSPNTMVRGRMINRAILDNTGGTASQMCANGMMSGLTSPSRPWFKLRQSINMTLDAAGQSWFDAVEDRMYRVMAGSNFYEAIHTMYGDLVSYGTAPMVIYEHPKRIIQCYNTVAGEYMLAVGSDMKPETLNRQFLMTVSAIVEMFGLENCPADIQGLWATKGATLETEKIVCHSVEPNFPVSGRDGQKREVLRGPFTYREAYWIWGSSGERPLSIRGFNEAPFVAPRWAVTSNDAYGRSPGMDALPDIMQLQLMTMRKGEAIEKQVRPPLLADQTLKNQPSSILPGHITYVPQLGPNNGMKPIYTVNPDLQYMIEDIKEIQGRIQRVFFNDLFMAVLNLDTVRSATEIVDRRAEKMTLLGPVIERFQNEALSPTIRRIFAIMARKGLLPPLPPSLRGVPVNIEYISPLAIAQRASATAGIERIFGVAGNLVGVWPEVKYKIDPLKALDKYADYLSIPREILRTDDEVHQMMDQEMQAQQQQQAQQNAIPATQGLADAGQTLSQTDVGGGQNALQLMLGLGGATPAGNA